VYSRGINGDVSGVKCMFCFTFGRERREGTGRTAKTMRHVNVPHIYKAFRPEYYLRHLRDHHPTLWKQFEYLCDPQRKLSFFDVKVPFANQITSHFATSASEVHDIAASVVYDIILHYFVNSSCRGIGSLEEYRHVDESKYLLKVKNVGHLELCVRHVSSGMSFHQAGICAQTTRLVFGVADLRGITEATGDSEKLCKVYRCNQFAAYSQLPMQW